MKEKMKQIMDRFHAYNSAHMAGLAFGLDDSIEYDALVVAPSFTPYKLGIDQVCTVTDMRHGAYISGYLVEKDGLKIAWIQTASGACNLIDHLSVCAELKFRHLIFIGAVGALKKGIGIGEIWTPTFSVNGPKATDYLFDTLPEPEKMERVIADPAFPDKLIAAAKADGIEIRKGSVYCTQSVALEYSHLDEIRAMDTDLIEMETAAFAKMADLIEVPAVALLVVSDNSASGVALVGRTEEEQAQYNLGRFEILPRLIFKAAGMKD